MGPARALEGTTHGTLGHLRSLLIAAEERLLLLLWKVLPLAARALLQRNQPQRAAMPRVARTHGLPAAAAAATMRLPLTGWTSQQAALHRQHLVLLLLPVPQARGVALGSSSTSRQPQGCHPAWLVVVVGAAQLQLPWKASQGRSRSPSTCRQQVSTALPLHLRGQLPPAGVHQPADEPPGRLPAPSRVH